MQLIHQHADVWQEDFLIIPIGMASDGLILQKMGAWYFYESGSP